MNARAAAFEPGTRAMGGGHLLARWSNRTGMAFTGTPGEATHRAGHVIDHVYSNVPFASTTRDDLYDCGSDHYPLLTTVPNCKRESPEQHRYIVPLRKTAQFDGLVRVGMAGLPRPRDMTTKEEADRAVEAFSEMWQSAIRTAGTAATESGDSAPWWTEECQRARNQWNTYDKTHPPGWEAEVPFAKREYLGAVRKAKRDYWRKVIDEAKSDQAIYKIVGWHKLEGRTRAPPLIHDGRQYEDTEEKAEKLRELILERFTDEDDLNADPLQDWSQEERHKEICWDTYATEEEVEKHTIKVTSTSPGVDAVTIALLKVCWEHVGRWYHELVNLCLRLAYFPKLWRRGEVAFIPKPGKKDKTSFRSWRPIALLSCLAKGLERLLAKRIAYQALRAKIASPQQAGALPKRSAMDLVTAFTHEAELALARRKRVSLVTMDIQGAFDALLPRRLLQRMRQQGWPLPVLRIVQSFLEDRYVRVRLDGFTTGYKRVKCGTPQGSPLSPILYLLYLVDLLREDPTLRFGYADDLALYRIGNSLKENAKALARDIRKVIDWGERHRVFFAPEKTELLHIVGKARDRDNPEIKVNETLRIQPSPLPPTRRAGTGDRSEGEEQKPALRWLGVWFDRLLSFARHVRERCARAMRVARHIRGLARIQYGPPAEQLRKATVTCVLPAALYGSEAWYGGRMKPAVNIAQAGRPEVSARIGGLIDEVDQVITTAARAVLPVWRTTPNATLHRDAGLPTADAALEIARLRQALRIRTVDAYHPLANRGHAPEFRRGRETRPKTKLQVLESMLPGIERPQVTDLRYPRGSLDDPTGGIDKKTAAKHFLAWEAAVPPWDIIVYSDGSQKVIDKTPSLGYGYTIYQGGQELDSGYASIDNSSVVFDAEAIGALRGLDRAIHLTRDQGERHIWVCVDNTAAIWCLRGNPSDSAQWAFRKFHELVDQDNECTVELKWCPGHEGIPGNERADVLAKAGITAPRDPEAGPTAAGLKMITKGILRDQLKEAWRKRSATLSSRYQGHSLTYAITCPRELQLPRPSLHRFLAIRTGHGDFHWYHRKFHHEDAECFCSCKRKKSPEHLVWCRESKKSFARWPRRPKTMPCTREEHMAYLKTLLREPEQFLTFEGVTNFFNSICP
jgi:ribonuclease HI